MGKSKQPMTLDAFPGYREAAAKLAALEAEHRRLEREIDELPEPFGNDAGADLLEQAERILAGEDVPEMESGQLVRLRHKLAILSRAIDAQRGVVHRERSIAGKKIYQARRSEHLALIRRGVAAMEELLDAMESIERFRRELASLHQVVGLDFAQFTILERSLRQLAANAATFGELQRKRFPDL